MDLVNGNYYWVEYVKGQDLEPAYYWNGAFTFPGDEERYIANDAYFVESTILIPQKTNE